MMDLEVLKNKALNTVNADMKRYQDAIDGMTEWNKRECICDNSFHHPCSKCSHTHQYNSVIQGIENKYWHG